MNTNSINPLCATHFLSVSLVVRLNLVLANPERTAPINPRGIQTPIDVSEMPQLHQTETDVHPPSLGKVNNNPLSEKLPRKVLTKRTCAMTAIMTAMMVMMIMIMIMMMDNHHHPATTVVHAQNNPAAAAADPSENTFFDVGICANMWTAASAAGSAAPPPGAVTFGRASVARSEPDVPFSLVAAPMQSRYDLPQQMGRIFSRLNVTLAFQPKDDGTNTNEPVTAVLHKIGCSDIVQIAAVKTPIVLATLRDTAFDDKLSVSFPADANAQPDAPTRPWGIAPNAVSRDAIANVDVDFDYARSIVVWRGSAPPWDDNGGAAFPDVVACCVLAPPVPLPLPSDTYRASIELTGSSKGAWDTGETDAWAPGDAYGDQTKLHTTLAVAQVFGPVDYHGKQARSLTRYDNQGYTLIRVNGKDKNLGSGDEDAYWHTTRTFTVDQGDMCVEGWLAWLFDEGDLEGGAGADDNDDEPSSSSGKACPVGSGCHSIFTAYHWLGDEVLVTRPATDDSTSYSYSEDINALFTSGELLSDDVVATVEVHESHDWDLSFHPPRPRESSVSALVGEGEGRSYTPNVRGMECSSWNNVKSSTWNATFPTLRTIETAYAGTDWASLPTFQGKGRDEPHRIYEYDIETTNVTRYYATRAWASAGQSEEQQQGENKGGGVYINRPLVRVVVERTSLWEFFDQPLDDDSLLAEEQSAVEMNMLGMTTKPRPTTGGRPVPIKTWTQSIRFVADIFSFDASYHPDDLTGNNDIGVDVFAPCLTRLRMRDDDTTPSSSSGGSPSAFVRWTEGLVGLQGVGSSEAQQTHGGLASVVRGCGCDNAAFATGLQVESSSNVVVGGESSPVSTTASTRASDSLRGGGGANSPPGRIFFAGAVASLLMVAVLCLLVVGVVCTTRYLKGRRNRDAVKHDDPANVEMT